MSVPGIPQNLVLQTANRQVYLSWSLVGGATSYNVQRSTDAVNYTVIASPSTFNYLDTTASVGTLYYYMVASTNGGGYQCIHPAINHRPHPPPHR